MKITYMPIIFWVLLNRIGQINRNINNQIPLSKKLMVTIWLLSKQESLLECGDRFGLSKNAAHKIFNEIINSICQLPQEDTTSSLNL